MLRNTAVWSVNGCFFFFFLFVFWFFICVGDLTGDLAELEFQAIVVERVFVFFG